MFAELLRRSRRLLGVKQEVIAQRLADLGHPVGQTAVSAWERDGAIPRNRERLEAIAAAYEIDVDLVLQAAALPRRKAAPAPAETAADSDRLERLEERMATLTDLLEQALSVFRAAEASPGGTRPADR